MIQDPFKQYEMRVRDKIHLLIDDYPNNTEDVLLNYWVKVKNEALDHQDDRKELIQFVISKQFNIKSENIEVLADIGSGFDSTVHKACIHDSSRIYKDQVVALKKYKEESENFENEKQIHLSLTHPNIIKLLALVEEPEAGYKGLVLEFADYGTLYDYSSVNKVNEQMYIHVLIDLFAALTYLHGQYIIHADVKLSNILVAKGSKRVVGKLCDFGLSMRMDKSTMKCTIDYRVGTKGYRAPELQEEDKDSYDYSAGSDMWAAGVVLTKMAGLKKQSGAPTGSPELYAFIDKCKKNQPNERASAQEGKEIMSRRGIKLW